MSCIWKRKLISLGTVALWSSVAHAAPAGTPVTIQESSVAGSNPHVFQADQLSGQYDEVVTFNTATTFTTDVIFDAGQWFNSGVAQATQLNAFGDTGYGLYVKFVATGTYSTTGSTTNFVFGNSSLQLFSDANHDTVYTVGATATGNLNGLNLAGSAADDVLLGTASATNSGTGSSVPGGVGTPNGNFEILLNTFNLANPGGLSYFTAPRPFNLALDLNGNFQSLVPMVGGSVQLLNNSANAFFIPNQTPEPSALALAGTALCAAAVFTRRRSRKR